MRPARLAPCSAWSVESWCLVQRGGGCAAAGGAGAVVRCRWVAGRLLAVLVLFGELGGKFGAACAGDVEGVAAGEGAAVVGAGAVGFAGEVVGLGADLVAGAFEVAAAVLQLDDDAERPVGAQLVVGHLDGAAGDACELQGQVRFEEAAGGGDDVEAGQVADVGGLVPGGELGGVGVGAADRGQRVAQRDRGVGAGAPSVGADGHGESVAAGVDAVSDGLVELGQLVLEGGQLAFGLVDRAGQGPLVAGVRALQAFEAGDLGVELGLLQDAAGRRWRAP